MLRRFAEIRGAEVDNGSRTHEFNPGEVWEENEFWIDLSWRINPDGSMGIRPGVVAASHHMGRWRLDSGSGGSWNGGDADITNDGTLWRPAPSPLVFPPAQTQPRRLCTLAFLLHPDPHSTENELMTRMTPSEAFVEPMVAHGVDTIFGIMGSAFMDAMDIFEPAGIELVPVVHEQGAAQMADGYSRVS